MSDKIQSKENYFSREALLPIYAALIAFLTYASVYAYRKPFTVATFDGIKFWNVA